MTEGLELDLHADAEHWQDNLDDDDCEACGGPRVVFIPAWADGSGILTPEEIAEVLGAARTRVIELFEVTQSGRLPAMANAMAEDVIMHIEGYRGGSFRAVLQQDAVHEGQSYNRYGRGSTYRGGRGWSSALARSRYVRQDTRPEEAEEGLIAYYGEPGVLNFTRHQPKLFDPDVPGSEEAFRLRRALKDRTSRLDFNARHRTDRPDRPAAQKEFRGNSETDSEGGGGGVL